VLFLPWLSGSIVPAPDGRQRGAFLGLSVSTTRADLVRAVLEGVALQVAWMRDGVEASLGRPFSTGLRVAGGGAQSDLWCAVMADALGTPVEQVAQPRLANARGAAALGLLALGRVDVGGLASLVPAGRRYEPEPRHAKLFAERREVFADLHGRLAPASHRLTERAP
jgi:xylulokinase